MSAKGSQFERDFCVRLSEWVSHGARDDLFWRSQASGARFTTRAKQARTTAGQAGDIAATDPSVTHLTQKVVWELKRGYQSADLHRLLEAPKVKNLLYLFISKTVATAKQAGAPYWIIVTRRNRGDALVWMPAALVKRANENHGIPVWTPHYGPQCRLSVVLPSESHVRGVCVMNERDFFEGSANAFNDAIKWG